MPISHNCMNLHAFAYIIIVSAWSALLEHYLFGRRSLDRSVSMEVWVWQQAESYLTVKSKPLKYQIDPSQVRSKLNRTFGSPGGVNESDPSMSLQELFVMFWFNKSWKTVVVHKCEYMFLCYFESVVGRIVHAVVDLCSNFSVQAYLRKERIQNKACYMAESWGPHFALKIDKNLVVWLLIFFLFKMHGQRRQQKAELYYHGFEDFPWVLEVKSSCMLSRSGRRPKAVLRLLTGRRPKIWDTKDSA